MRITPTGIALVVVTILLSWQGLEAAHAQTSRRAIKARASATPSHMERVNRKFQEVLANQDQILQKFDAVMEELRIVKIRVSR